MLASELSPRLDRLPVSRFHRRIMYGVCFAFFFELADLNSFAYAATGLQKYQHMSVGTIANVTSASFAGMFLGAVFGGRLADRLGRRRALIWSVVWFSLFSLLNAVAPNTAVITLARFLTGVGLSAMTVIAITYLAELMPQSHRGRMQGAALAIGLIGIPAMAFFARAVVPTGPDGWRWVFVGGAVGVASLALILRLPESPRWLLDRGRAEEAEATLAAIEAEVTRSVGELPPPAAVTAAAPVPAVTGVKDLFRGGLGGRTLMLVGAWVFQTLGFYGFTSWVPVLLADHGFTLTKSLTFTAVTTIGAVPGALLAWVISDRYRRKSPLIAVAVVTAVCGLAYGLTFNTAAIIVFGFGVSFFIQTFAALLYAYTPELYPTSLRNTGSGVAYGTGRLANIAGPFIVSAIYGGSGYPWVFVYIAACWACAALVIALFGPRTGDVALEQLQPAASG
ncbi:MAG: MFS transporter [Streptosporangiales bacterium]|nr:MFS transporter [Streptosporangiales bacterium]